MSKHGKRNLRKTAPLVIEHCAPAYSGRPSCLKDRTHPSSGHHLELRIASTIFASLKQNLNTSLLCFYTAGSCRRCFMGWGERQGRRVRCWGEAPGDEMHGASTGLWSYIKHSSKIGLKMFSVHPGCSASHNTTVCCPCSSAIRVTGGAALSMGITDTQLG